MCSKSEALIILTEVLERSRAIFGSSLVNGYLYGSYARGDYDTFYVVAKSDVEEQLANAETVITSIENRLGI